MKTFIIQRNESPRSNFVYFGRAASMTDAKRSMRALGFKPSEYVIEELLPKALAHAEHTLFAQPGFAESKHILVGRFYFRK